MFSLDDLVKWHLLGLSLQSYCFPLSMLCSLEASPSDPAYTQEVEGGAGGFKGSDKKNWINGCHCGIHVSSTDRSLAVKVVYLRGRFAFHLTLQVLFSWPSVR